jgi:hypothetical protein
MTQTSTTATAAQTAADIAYLDARAERCRADVLAAIPAARQHNRTMRPASMFGATDAMLDSDEYTIITALYIQLDDRYHRSEVEAALIALSRASKIGTCPTNAQGDLTEYDRTFALRTGNQDHHWIYVL